MCMDGDNLAPENRLDNLECKCFPALSRLSHLSHRVSHLSKTLSHLDFQRNSWSRDDLGRSWRLLRHQLLASLSRPYKEVSGPLQETPRAWKVWPHHRADQHTEHEASPGENVEKISCFNIFLLRRFLENAPAWPSLSTTIMSTELGNVSQSAYFLLFPIIFIKSSYIYSSSIKDTRQQWHPLVSYF